jgi:hypothetical protein
MYQELPRAGSAWAPIRTAGEPPPAPFTDEPRWASRLRQREPQLVGVGAYGWPAVCLISHSAWDGAGQVRDADLWITPEWLGPVAGLRLPLCPLARGMTIDMAFFAGGWALLLVGAPMLRRTLRRRRGLCPACGYILAGTAAPACPECGQPSGGPRAATAPSSAVEPTTRRA